MRGLSTRAQYISLSLLFPGQLFNSWEVKGQNTAVGLDINTHAGDARLGLLDDAHTLAFRGGLGNTVNAPSFQV